MQTLMLLIDETRQLVEPNWAAGGLALCLGLFPCTHCEMVEVAGLRADSEALRKRLCASGSRQKQRLGFR